jgi:AraC-like DNA-binding protein
MQLAVEKKPVLPAGTSDRQGTVSIDLLKVLLGYAQSRGIPPGPICLAAGVADSDLADAGRRLSLGRYNAAWVRVQQDARDDCFGLHLGETALDAMSGHALMALAMNGATVESALTAFIGFHDVASDAVRPQFDARKSTVRLRLSAKDPGLRAGRHQADFLLALLSTLLERLAPGAGVLRAVRFSHRRPAAQQAYQRVFACPVAFGAAADALMLSADGLGRPVLPANPVFFDTLCSYLQARLERVGTATVWSDRVTREISRRLAAGEPPALRAVARRLALSRRVLQSRLRAEGTTFSAVVDGVRCEAAKRLLANPELSLAEVAALLGFAEQSSLNHAFRRWTGLRPGVYRRRPGVT